MITPVTSLELRLTRLEKSARRWKLAASALFCCAVAAISLGQGIVIRGGAGGGMTTPRVIADNVVVNKSIVLNDANGNARVTIAMDNNDLPAIAFTDKDDHTLVSIAVQKDGGKILIQDAKGKKLFAAP